MVTSQVESCTKNVPACQRVTKIGLVSFKSCFLNANLASECLYRLWKSKSAGNANVILIYEYNIDPLILIYFSKQKLKPSSESLSDLFGELPWLYRINSRIEHLRGYISGALPTGVFPSWTGWLLFYK